MGRTVIVASLLAATLLAGCHASASPMLRPASQGAFAPQKREAAPRILVKFKAQLRAADLKAFRAHFGTRNVGMIASIDVYVEEVVGDTPVDELLTALNRDPQVQYAELDGEIGISH